MHVGGICIDQIKKELFSAVLRRLFTKVMKIHRIPNKSLTS